MGEKATVVLIIVWSGNRSASRGTRLVLQVTLYVMHLWSMELHSSVCIERVGRNGNGHGHGKGIHASRLVCSVAHV